MKRNRYIFLDQASGGDGGSAGNGAAGSPPPATGGESWYSGFSTPELRGVVENNGWKSPEDAVRNYAELSKKLGVPKDRLLTLPERSDDAEGWNSIYSRLGRPEKAEDYGLEKLKNADPAYAGVIAKVMHEAGVSKAQATKIVEAHSKFLDDYLAKQEADRNTKIEADKVQLKGEWGDQYQSTIERGGMALKELWGDQADTITAALQEKLGYLGAAKAIAKLADKAGEATFRQSGAGTGSSGMGGMSPDGAKAEIERLKTDRDFVQAYINGDSVARERMTNLQKIAFPGLQQSSGASSGQ
jgi:hypothetical protein